MADLQEGNVKDDTVEYRLYCSLPADVNVLKYLEDQRDTFLAFLSRYCIGYIWQHEPFQLRLQVTTTASVPTHLFGTTCYGDNVEDEWFIVFLLLKLTNEFPDVIVSICDSDGEFLLIEAADHLPKWLNPETAENRIFLNRGQMHVVPRTLKSETPSVAEALNYIRSNPASTAASSGIQQDIQHRIAGFPGKSEESIQYAHCYLPAPLAAVLDHSPQLVAPIVQAFYHRDPLDLKACITFKHFRPGTRIMRRVKLTRCLYAQLIQQQFTPDRRSGYTLPPANNAKFKAYDLGAKLAHGCEILCSKYNCDDVTTAESSEKLLRSDTRWQHFVSSLASKGYFKGELEGSKLYSRLLNDAWNFYKCSSVADNVQTDSSDVGYKILSVLKSVNFDVEQMRQEEKSLLPADDDSWLNIGPDDLEQMLGKMSGRPTAGVNDLGQVNKSMKAFIENVSSHEGAEFPQSEDDVSFDPNSFMQTMQKIFEFDDAASNSSSDMDEYESDEELGDMSRTRSKPTPVGRTQPSVVMGTKMSTTSSTTKTPTSQQPSSVKSTPASTGSKPKPPVAAKPNVANGSAGSGKKPGMAAPGGDGDVGSFLGMKEYMEAMDRELAKTTVGQSFVREGDEVIDDARPKVPPRRKKTPQSTPQTKPSSRPAPASAAHRHDDDIDDEDDDFRPVNVDLNTVKNLLESYEAQRGLPGPASNILGSMGVRLPAPADDDDDM